MCVMIPLLFNQQEKQKNLSQKKSSTMVNGWMREHMYKNMVKDQTKNETNKLKNGCKNWRPHWTFQHFLAWTATRTQKMHRNKEN
jgi:hypothetical protein